MVENTNKTIPTFISYEIRYLNGSLVANACAVFTIPVAKSGQEFIDNIENVKKDIINNFIKKTISDDKIPDFKPEDLHVHIISLTPISEYINPENN